MFNSLRKSNLFYLFLFSYVFLVIWWVKIFLSGVRETDENYLFGFTYSFIALIGGIQGLFISRVWGGTKSLMGRGIIFFSLGLLSLWFGQASWTYYNVILRVEVPYPSIADIGYFLIIPFYSLGMFYFAKASGAKVTLRRFRGKFIACTLPLIMGSIAYILFLRNLEPDLTQPIRTFLDFGYPIGEAITISIALVTFVLSQSVLGGKMRKKILYLIFALVVQYVTDYTFTYTAAAGTYYNAGVVDLMYTTSFTVMAIGLLALKEI